MAQRMKITDDINVAFSDQCVVDGDFKYIPRDHLMNALHMMGCNPTYQTLEELIPEVGEDVRVDFDEFKECYEKVKHTKGFDKKALLEAFYTFDRAQSGILKTEEFLMAMGCGDNDMRGQEQAELLATADPFNTGEVDYVAFANKLCPDPPKPKREKRVKRDKEPEPEPEPEPEVDTRDYDGEARAEAMQDMMSSLLKEANHAEKDREHLNAKLAGWLDALRTVDLPEVNVDDVRVDRDSTEEESASRSKNFQEHKKRTETAQADLARYEQEYQSLLRSLESQRRSADSTYASLPSQYSNDTYDSIRAQLHILFQCRHRIASNTWQPIVNTERGRIDFLSGCGGSEDPDRGTHPALEPAGAEDEIVAFKIGSYIHHGTSPQWEGGTICLLPPDMLEQHGNTAAARLLTVPCELESLGCPVDVDTQEAVACRSAFYDGVNGKRFDESLVGKADEEVLTICHQRGLWYNSEVSSEQRDAEVDPLYAGCPHHLLKAKRDLKMELESLHKRVDTASTLVHAIEDEDNLFSELISEAFNKKDDTDREATSSLSTEKAAFDRRCREIEEEEEAERRRREEEEARKKREEEERKRREAEEAKKKEAPKPAPKPAEKPKEVPKKGGGGCC